MRVCFFRSRREFVNLYTCSSLSVYRGGCIECENSFVLGPSPSSRLTERTEPYIHSPVVPSTLPPPRNFFDFAPFLRNPLRSFVSAFECRANPIRRVVGAIRLGFICQNSPSAPVSRPIGHYHFTASFPRGPDLIPARSPRASVFVTLNYSSPAAASLRATFTRVRVTSI